MQYNIKPFEVLSQYPQLEVYQGLHEGKTIVSYIKHTNGKIINVTRMIELNQLKRFDIYTCPEVAEMPEVFAYADKEKELERRQHENQGINYPDRIEVYNIGDTVEYQENERTVYRIEEDDLVLIRLIDNRGIKLLDQKVKNDSNVKKLRDPEPIDELTLALISECSYTSAGNIKKKIAYNGTNELIETANAGKVLKVQQGGRAVSEFKGKKYLHRNTGEEVKLKLKDGKTIEIDKGLCEEVAKPFKKIKKIKGGYSYTYEYVEQGCELEIKIPKLLYQDSKKEAEISVSDIEHFIKSSSGFNTESVIWTNDNTFSFREKPEKCTSYSIRKSYHNGNPKFRNGQLPNLDKTKVIGIEIEYHGIEDHINTEAFRKKYADHDLYHIESDGSIRDGAELITVPLDEETLFSETLKKMGKVVQNISKALKEGKTQKLKRGYARHLDQKESGRTEHPAGMHIHISRKWIKKEEARFIKNLIHNNKGRTEKYVGRMENTYCKRDEGYETGKYQSLNMEKSQTIEMRMFASPLSSKEFKEMVCFALALVIEAKTYIKDHGLNSPEDREPLKKAIQERTFTLYKIK